jgi:exosortase
MAEETPPAEVSLPRAGATLPRAASVRALSRSEWALAALLVAAFLPALQAMAQVWRSVDYYSHGFLVPLVSLWVLLRTRPRRRRLAVAPGGGGLLLLAASLGLYAVGLAASLVTLQGIAFVGAVAGAVWLRRGRVWLRALAFPVGFLLFMVPLPESWLAPTITGLRLLVSQASVVLLQAFGNAVAHDGNVLLLPSGESLFVAEACSGVTSLVTLTPLAVLIAHLTERSTVRRVLLVLSVVPIALAGNLVRVVATVLAAERIGAQAASQGPLHEMTGLTTYVLGCLVLLGVGRLLRRVVPDRRAA